MQASTSVLTCIKIEEVKVEDISKHQSTLHGMPQQQVADTHARILKLKPYLCLRLDGQKRHITIELIMIRWQLIARLMTVFAKLIQSFGGYWGQWFEYET